MLKLYVTVTRLLRDLREDVGGATIVEYSLLIGLLTVAIILSVAGIGTWLGVQWTALCTATGATCV